MTYPADRSFGIGLHGKIEGGISQVELGVVGCLLLRFYVEYFFIEFNGFFNVLDVNGNVDPCRQF